jgi:hypothetical protein
MKIFTNNKLNLNNILEPELLIDKNNLEKKETTEQLLNIIIIKNSIIPLKTIIPDISNLHLNISIISNIKEDISHCNVISYVSDIKNQKEILNDVIKNNKSKYFMIIDDSYVFDYDFIEKLLKDIYKFIEIEALLLFRSSNNNNYFRVSRNCLKTMSEPYICIINDNIKKTFDYSLNTIGIFLYINQILNNYNSVLASTDYNFSIENSLHDVIKLFNIYNSNIEDDIINRI